MTEGLVLILVTVVSAVIAFFLGRRKSEAEVADISARVYKQLVTDLEEEVAKNKSKMVILCAYIEHLENLLIERGVVDKDELNRIKTEVGL